MVVYNTCYTSAELSKNSLQSEKLSLGMKLRPFVWGSVNHMLVSGYIEICARIVD